MTRLAVVAPTAYRDALGPARWPGVAVAHHELPPPVERPVDAYRITERLEDGEYDHPDALLVVAPRNRSPRTAAPPAIVATTAVGLVQANRPGDLDDWLAARRRQAATPPTVEAAICGMGKRLFAEVSQRWIDRLDGDGWAVEDFRAQRTSRTELCAALASGPEIVVYAGHGRARGWAGYQALRWPSIESVPTTRPTGLVIALACDTLTRSRGVVAFGSRWVASGRAVAYLGWCGSLRIEPGLRVADRMCDALVACTATTPAGLLRQLARTTRDRTEVRELRRLRLIGDPLATLARHAISSAAAPSVRAGAVS